MLIQQGFGRYYGAEFNNPVRNLKGAWGKVKKWAFPELPVSGPV